MPQKIIMVARVGAPHGVRGLLKLHTFLENPKLLTQFKHFYLRYPKQDWQSAMPFSLTKKSEQFFIHFNGFEQPESAGLKFTHAELGVPRSDLPKLSGQRYYWEDLLGLKVVNQEGQELGTVDHLFATPAHDIVVVKHAPEDILIPYVWERFIVSVDIEARVMVVDWEL